MAHKRPLLKVAQMKFRKGLFNYEIANALEPGKNYTSADNVKWVSEIIDDAGRMLLDSHDRLIRYEAQNIYSKTLAQRLCKSFDLSHAIVVKAEKMETLDDYTDIITRYGRAAADYFDSVLLRRAQERQQPLHVLMSGGSTILAFANNLAETVRPSVFFYPAAIIGRANSNTSTHISPETTSTLAWARSGGFPQHLYVATVSPYDIAADLLCEENPAFRHEGCIDAIRTQKANIESSANFAATLNAITKSIDVAFAGFGVLSSPPFPDEPKEIRAVQQDRLTIRGLLTPMGVDAAILEKEGAIGELSYNFFDKNGRGKDEWDIFTTARRDKRNGLDYYRGLVKQKKKVIVMAGALKEEVLKQALNAQQKLFNVLITDSNTAEYLLKS